MEIGLIGKKLGHSLSAEIHAYLGDYSYDLIELDESELDEFFAKRDFRGINVTIPYKLNAFEFCDELSATAKKIGCVNTVIKRADGTLYGDNTDYFGFRYMADRALIDFSGKKTVILGSGGASLTARIVAADAGASEVFVISRTGANNYENLGRHYDAEIIVNCTPVGMYPDIGKKIVDIKPFTRLEGVLDMIYNPCFTPLLNDARDRGVKYSNGLPMLVAQAYKSAELFRLPGDSPKAGIDEIIATIANNQRNIVLCGMPGCGKSTLAAALSISTGREAIDTDAMIEKKAGTTIPEIFAARGEEYFRELEAECVRSAAALSGKIIATGGGAVLRESNRELLRENSVVVFLERDVVSLSRDGRPLSKDTATLERMYAERYPLYVSIADVVVPVDDDPAITLKKTIYKVGEYFENSCD